MTTAWTCQTTPKAAGLVPGWLICIPSMGDLFDARQGNKRMANGLCNRLKINAYQHITRTCHADR
jgi:hypothetical protein